MIRVRFAPSPTGNLHIGGARSALFNFLFAKHYNGKFVLRIEDTDPVRSKKEFEDNIIESMKWLGLEWDELYRQSERMGIYKEYSDKLFKANKLYKCFCKKEELDEKRKNSEVLKKAFKYDGKCSRLSAEEVKKLEDAGNPYVLRFKIEQGETEIDDLVRGKIKFDNNELDDFVVARSDRVPTYNFCVVIDDALMNITHIIRGEDHISNTPRQVLLYKALSFTVPKFAHIPLILSSDRSKMSKRAGAASVTEYRDLGYLPEATVNFLAMMGCSFDENRDIYSLKELSEKFDINKVNKSPAIFNFEKLDFLNGFYIRQKSVQELAGMVKPFLVKSGINADDKLLSAVLTLEKDRLKKLSELAELSAFFFIDKLDFDPEGIKKHKNPETIKLLAEYTEGLNKLASFDKVVLEEYSRKFTAEKNLKLGAIVHPARLALTGKLASPGIFEVMETLGRETTLSRLKIFVTMT